MVAALIIILAVCAVFYVIAEATAIISMVSDLKALRAVNQQHENDYNKKCETKSTTPTPMTDFKLY